MVATRSRRMSEPKIITFPRVENRDPKIASKVVLEFGLVSTRLAIEMIT